MYWDRVRKARTCSIQSIRDFKSIFPKHWSCCISKRACSILLYFFLMMLQADPEERVTVIRRAAIWAMDRSTHSVATRTIVLNAFYINYFDQTHLKLAQSRDALQKTETYSNYYVARLLQSTLTAVFKRSSSRWHEPATWTAATIQEYNK